MPPKTHALLDTRVRAEEPRLKAYLRRRLQAGEDVEDYVQEVYARVLARPPAAEVESWQALLRRVAANLIIDRARRAHVRFASGHVGLEPQDDILDEQPTAEEAHDNVMVYWMPAAPVAPDRPLELSWRLHWSNVPRFGGPAGWVGATRQTVQDGATAQIAALIDGAAPAGRGQSTPRAILLKAGMHALALWAAGQSRQDPAKLAALVADTYWSGIGARAR